LAELQAPFHHDGAGVVALAGAVVVVVGATNPTNTRANAASITRNLTLSLAFKELTLSKVLDNAREIRKPRHMHDKEA
jgi:hypothetical protein